MAIWIWLTRLSPSSATMEAGPHHGGGERRVAPEELEVWFTPTVSFAKALSAGNYDKLRVIAEKAPGSLDALARITGKARPNLSRTLRTMEGSA